MRILLMGGALSLALAGLLAAKMPNVEIVDEHSYRDAGHEYAFVANIPKLPSPPDPIAVGQALQQHPPPNPLGPSPKPVTCNLLPMANRKHKALVWTPGD
jgi:hypothetical protein